MKVWHGAIVCIGCCISGCGHKQNVVQRPLAKVEVGEIQESDIPIFLEGIGHVRAYNYAEIKSQVEGELFQVHYDQGERVGEGEMLVTIDPRPYQAKLQEAEGMLLESKANLKFAEEKVMRYTKLVKEEYVSQLDYDQFVTDVEALLATIKQNEGSLADAKVNLEYCYIRAPFSGRVGKRLIDKGNLIPNDGSPLLILNQTQPIYVDFSLPEKDLTRILMHQRKGEHLVVKVHIPENTLLEEEGKLVVIDNQVDPSTGMIGMRAEFSNECELLWPGQFAKVRLILENKKHAILAPEEGINLSQKGYFALVVDSANKASMQPVKVGEQIGGVWEILEGLKQGDKIVTKGQLNVRAGEEVNVVGTSDHLLKRLEMW